jgi:hypothetical protein
MRVGNRSMYARSLVALLLVLIGIAQAQTSSPENYFQVRFFGYYPNSLANQNLLNQITVDTNLVWNIPLDPNPSSSRAAKITFGIINSNLITQAIKLEGIADFGYALLQFDGGTGSELGARRNGLTSLLLYNIPRSNDPQAVQYLGGLGLTYLYQSDSGSNGYRLNYLDFSARGAIANAWTWNSGYGLSSTSLNSTAAGSTTHSGRLEVRGNVGPLDLASNTQLRVGDNNQTPSNSVDERVEVKYKITDLEDLTTILHYATQSETVAKDDETISFTTSRPKPFTLGGSIGRRSPNAITWGLNGVYQENGWNIAIEYGGTGGDSAEHHGSFGVRYREKTWSLGSSLSTSANLDPSSSLWFGRAGWRLEGNTKLEMLTFTARGSLEYQASLNSTSPWSASVDLRASGNFNPIRLDLGVNFSYRQSMTGKANLQVLYNLLPNLSLNLTLDYQRTLTPITAEQYGLGLGLRFLF